MTHIRLVQSSFERVNVEQLPVPPDTPSRKKLSGIRALFVLSALLTAANFAGIAYMTVLVRQLSDFSSKIDYISQFEQRISERLETFNDGIHAQFDKLNANLTGDLHSAATSKRRQFYHVSSRLLDNALTPPNYRYLSAFGSSPYGEGDNAAEDNPLADRAGFGGSAASSMRIANFVRTELPNGKIVYKAAE
jgi:hypothetical protein